MEKMENKTLQSVMMFTMTVVSENLWVKVSRFEVTNRETHKTLFVQFNEELSESTQQDLREKMLKNDNVDVVDFSEDRSFEVTNMFVTLK